MNYFQIERCTIVRVRMFEYDVINTLIKFKNRQRTGKD